MFEVDEVEDKAAELDDDGEEAFLWFLGVDTSVSYMMPNINDFAAEFQHRVRDFVDDLLGRQRRKLADQNSSEKPKTPKKYPPVPVFCEQ